MAPRIFLPLLLVVVGLGVWCAYSQSEGAYSDAGLVAYVTSERLDPIFAIEGTDPKKLENALSEFFSERNQIAKRYTGGDEATIQSLYPADFLELLPKLESARQTMFASSTIENARVYHSLLTQTIKAYADDASRVAQLVRSTAQTYPAFQYVAGTAKPSDIATTIEAAGVGAREQLQKENKRYACITNSASCAPVPTLLQARIERIGSPAPVSMPTAQIYRVASLVRSLTNVYRSYVRTEPVLLVIPSTCVPSSTVAYVQAYYLSNQHGVAHKLSFVHDAYFFDIAGLAVDIPSTGEYSRLLSAGVAWQFQNLGNLYECPDSGFDQTAAASLLGTLTALRTHASSTEVQHILSITALSKADLAPYVRRVAATDTSEATAIVERYLEGSSDFDQIVLGALNDNGFLLASTTAQTKLPPIDFVVLTRNYASTLFMMGNPTFVPNPQSLFNSHTSSGLTNFHLRSYLSDLSKRVSVDTLVAQLKKSLDLEYPVTP